MFNVFYLSVAAWFICMIAQSAIWWTVYYDVEAWWWTVSRSLNI